MYEVGFFFFLSTVYTSHRVCTYIIFDNVHEIILSNVLLLKHVGNWI